MDRNGTAENVRSERVSSAYAYFDESNDKNDGLPLPQADIACYRDVPTLRLHAEAPLTWTGAAGWHGVAFVMPCGRRAWTSNLQAASEVHQNALPDRTLDFHTAQWASLI